MLIGVLHIIARNVPSDIRNILNIILRLNIMFFLQLMFFLQHKYVYKSIETIRKKA